MATNLSAPQDGPDELDQVTADIDALAQGQQTAGTASPGPQPGGSPPPQPRLSPPGDLSGVHGEGPVNDAPPQEDNWVQRTLRGMGPIGLALAHPSTLFGIAAGATRAPGQAVGAATDLGVDIGTGLANLIPSETIHQDTQFVRTLITAGAQYWGRDPESPTATGNFANMASARSTVGQIGNTDVNQTTAFMLSLAIGYGGAGTLANGTRVGAALERGIEAISAPFLRGSAIAARAATQGAVVDAALMDPETERFSNALQNMGVHSEFTDWLSHDDEEGHWEGRFKNALEGTLTGLGMEALVASARYWRASLRGDTAAADALRGEITSEYPPPAIHPEPIEAVPASEATPPEPSQVPPGEVLVGWGRNEDGTLFPQYGKPVTQSTVPMEPGPGPIAVEPGAAPNTAPGPEVVGEEPTTTSATEAHPSPSSPPAEPQPGADNIVVFQTAGGKPVGSIDREGLTILGENINMFRAVTDAVGREGADITHALTSDAASRLGEIHIAPLGSVDNVPGLLRAISENIPAADRPRPDANLMQDAWKAAGTMGEDPAAILEAGRLIAGKLQDSDTAMAVLRTLWARSAGVIDRLNIPGVDWAGATDEEFATAAQAVHDMTTLSAYVQQAKQGLGRGLRVNQLPDAETYLGTLAKRDADVAPMAPGERGPLPRTRTELKNWMEVWDNYKNDPVRRANFLQGALVIPSAQKYLRQSFANFFTGSILSAPRTLLLNLVGPGIISTLRMVERQGGAMMASLNPTLTAAQRADARAVARSTVPAYFSTLNDTADVFYQALQAMKTNRTILGGGGSIDTATAFGPITPNILQAAGKDPGAIGRAGYSLGNLINVWPAAVARFNNGFDEFAKRMAYNGEVRVRAMMQGVDQGLSGDELHAFIGEKLRNSVDEVGRARDEEMLRAAERTTLTATPGEAGTWQRRMANGMNQLRRDVPELRYILPVFNVPVNGLGEVLRRTPIAFVPGVNRALGFGRTAGELAGDFGPVAQAEAHGRFMMGASFLASGIMMTRMGMMTGAGPQDAADRATWLATHQPYSVRIGDEWVRYDRYDIMGGLLSIPATVADATIYRRADRGQQDLVYGAVGALAQWFKDRAALRGAAGLLSMGDNPATQAGNVLPSMGGQILAGFVPNALQATVTQPLDPVLRLRSGWLDYLKAAIPGLSQELPAVRNVFGEPVNRASDTLLEGVFPISMAPAQSSHPDPELDELDRLYQATGFGASGDARNMGHGFFNPQDVILENGRNLYDAAMHARQTVTVDGQTLRQAMHELLSSPDYHAAVDAGPSDPTTSLGDVSRGWLVERLLTRYNHAITSELAQASPRARAFLTASEAKVRDSAYLQDLSVDQLVGNPDLYHTRGIDASLYSDTLTAGATGSLIQALRPSGAQRP